MAPRPGANHPRLAWMRGGAASLRKSRQPNQALPLSSANAGRRPAVQTRSSAITTKIVPTAISVDTATVAVTRSSSV